MQRPVLFRHNHKRLTMVRMKVKLRENREGLRILCCISKVSGHLGASASLKSLQRGQDAAAVPAPSRPRTTVSRRARGSKAHSSLLPQPSLQRRETGTEPFHHRRPNKGGQREAEEVCVGSLSYPKCKSSTRSHGSMWAMSPSPTRRPLGGPAAGPLAASPPLKLSFLLLSTTVLYTG